jgi:hypothetical protein
MLRDSNGDLRLAEHRGWVGTYQVIEGASRCAAGVAQA